MKCAQNALFESGHSKLPSLPQNLYETRRVKSYPKPFIFKFYIVWEACQLQASMPCTDG